MFNECHRVINDETHHQKIDESIAGS